MVCIACNHIAESQICTQGLCHMLLENGTKLYNSLLFVRAGNQPSINPCPVGKLWGWTEETPHQLLERTWSVCISSERSQ